MRSVDHCKQSDVNGSSIRPRGANANGTMPRMLAKALKEATGLLRAPQRVPPLVQRLVSDKIRITFEQKHLYSYSTSKRSSAETLGAVVRWIVEAQRRDGGIAA